MDYQTTYLDGYLPNHMNALEMFDKIFFLNPRLEALGKINQQYSWKELSHEWFRERILGSANFVCNVYGPNTINCEKQILEKLMDCYLFNATHESTPAEIGDEAGSFLTFQALNGCLASVRGLVAKVFLENLNSPTTEKNIRNSAKEFACRYFELVVAEKREKKACVYKQSDWVCLERCLKIALKTEAVEAASDLLEIASFMDRGILVPSNEVGWFMPRRIHKEIVLGTMHELYKLKK